MYYYLNRQKYGKYVGQSSRSLKLKIRKYFQTSSVSICTTFSRIVKKWKLTASELLITAAPLNDIEILPMAAGLNDDEEDIAVPSTPSTAAKL